MIEINGRYKDAVWYRKGTQVLIGGAGGIGSHLAFMLTRAGFFPTIYDFDTIEAQNIGGQLYVCEQVGTEKVESLSKLIKEFTGINISVKNTEYTEQSNYSRFMFSCFDNMAARRTMLENFKKESAKDKLFVDGRLSFENFLIYCVQGKDIERYEETLFDDELAIKQPCTLQQTTHVASMIASMMTALFTNHLTNIFEGNEIRYVPFKTEVMLPLMAIKSEQ